MTTLPMKPMLAPTICRSPPPVLVSWPEPVRKPGAMFVSTLPAALLVAPPVFRVPPPVPRFRTKPAGSVSVLVVAVKLSVPPLVSVVVPTPALLSCVMVTLFALMSTVEFAPMVVPPV